MSQLTGDFIKDFTRIVEDNASEHAFLFGNEINDNFISYGGFQDLINRCIKFFQQKGLKPGDTILCMMPNSLEVLTIFFATIKGGYNFAPISHDSTIDDFMNWKNLVKPQIVMANNSLSPDIKPIFEDIKKEQSILIDIDGNFSWLPESWAVINYCNHDSLLFIATSGTSGRPKAIVIDSKKLWSSACEFVKLYKLDQQEYKVRFWNYLSMSYLGGLFNLALIPICCGGSVLIDRPFSGKTFLGYWQTIERYNINIIWVVPTIVNGLLQIGKRSKDVAAKYSSLIKMAFVGTAPMSLAAKTEFKELFGIELYENFGLSETTFISAENIDNLNLRQESSVGELLSFIDIKLIDCDNADFANENVKEIYVKSPFLFKGYLQNDGSIDSSLDADGYFATGDVGYINSDNSLIILGRKRDIIKKGGFFVSLREIEIVAQSCPLVVEAAAVRKQHEFYGETFTLFLVTNDLNKEEYDNIGRYIRNKITQFKWPDKIEFVEKLPKSSSGKVKKHLLSGSK